MTLHPTYEPHKEQRQLRRLLMATGVGFTILVLAVALIGGAYHYLSVKSEDFIQALRRKTGLSIQVGEKKVGLKRIDFSHVTISGNPGSVIQHIGVTTDLGEAQVDRLEVSGAKLNLSTAQLSELLQLFVPRTGLRAKLTLAGSSSRLLPQVLKVSIPELRIWHGGKSVLTIKQLSLVYSEKLGKGKLTFAGVDVQGKTFLSQGVATLTGSLTAGTLRLRLLNQQSSQQDQFVLSAALDRQKKQANLQLRGRGINWGAVPGVANLVVNHRALPLALNMNLKLGRSGQVLMSWSAASGKASLYHPKVAKHPVYPLILRSQGQLGVDLDRRELTVYKSQWSAGATAQSQVTAHVGLKVKLAAEENGALVGGYLKLPSTGCQTLLDAIPVNVGDVFDEFHAPAGEVAGVVRFRFDTREPSKFVYKLTDDKLSCRFRSDEPTYSRSRLLGSKPVVSSFQLANQYVSEFPYDSFIALPEVPRHVQDAFLVSEDAGFYRHKGFSLATFEAALRRNLEEGRAALGASTITMQTAKNLWLSGEKTLTRKLQEALLTLYLEDTLSKDRVLEIYLNIVEFGPGLYGIRNAAEHFFDKTVEELNSLEAVYLASLLPSPVKRYTYFCRGYVTPGYRKLMNQKLEWMEQFNKIDQTTYEAAKRARLVFDRSHREQAQYCPPGALRFSANPTN